MITPVVTRRGLAIKNILFAAVFLPTLALLTEHWKIWGVLLVLSFLISLCYVKIYPSLLIYRSTYLNAQILGGILGLLIYIFPATRVAMCLVWGVIYILYFAIPFKNILFIVSSKKSVLPDSDD